MEKSSTGKCKVKIVYGMKLSPEWFQDFLDSAQPEAQLEMPPGSNIEKQDVETYFWGTDCDLIISNKNSFCAADILTPRNAWILGDENQIVLVGGSTVREVMGETWHRAIKDACEVIGVDFTGADWIRA